jgi:hypothetical protein
MLPASDLKCCSWVRLSPAGGRTAADIVACFIVFNDNGAWSVIRLPRYHIPAIGTLLIDRPPHRG